VPGDGARPRFQNAAAQGGRGGDHEPGGDRGTAAEKADQRLAGGRNGISSRSIGGCERDEAGEDALRVSRLVGDANFGEEREAELIGKRLVEGGLLQQVAFDRRHVGRDADSLRRRGRLPQEVHVDAMPGEERDLGRQRGFGNGRGRADGLTLNRQGG
jgi:hypothetical protein